MKNLQGICNGKRSLVLEEGIEYWLPENWASVTSTVEKCKILLSL